MTSRAWISDNGPSIFSSLGIATFYCPTGVIERRDQHNIPEPQQHGLRVDYVAIVEFLTPSFRLRRKCP